MFRQASFLLRSKMISNNSFRLYNTKSFFEQVTPTFFKHIPSQHQPDTPLALFDFDWTLCATRSGRTLPLFPKDVRLIYPAAVYQEKIPWNTHRVVIVTNQTRHMKEFETRVAWFLEEIGKDAEVWMSTDFDNYRIPATGMWDIAVGKNVNPKNSFYVGKRGGRLRDISCADRVFTWNVGINFYTPEEYFIDDPREDYAYDGLVELFLKDRFTSKEGQWNQIPWLRNEQELVLFGGYIVSGKSYICDNFFQDPRYKILDVSELKRTEQSETVGKTLEDGHSVVLNMSLLTPAERTRYIKIARSVNPKIKVRCIFVQDVDEKLAFHLDMFREKTSGIRHNATTTYKSVAKKYIPPTLEEGYDELQTIDFAPQFDDPEKRRLFYQSVSA